MVHREYDNGVLFSLDSKEEASEQIELSVPTEDVTAHDVDLEASAIVDGDDEVCECMIVDRCS